MDLTRLPSAIAVAAAEEIRALNHRTLDPAAFQYPGNVSDVVNALATLAERLDQSISQAGAGLRRLHDEQAIRVDDGSDVDQRVAEVAQELLSAQIALGALKDHLRAAASPLTHMGGLWEDDEPSRRSNRENRETTPVFEVEQSGANTGGWDPDDPYGDVEERERAAGDWS
jgi:hypothetical protein